MKKCILFAGIGMLAACTVVSGVDRKQSGYLFVTSHGRISLISWNAVRNAGIKHAKAYCLEQNKELHTVEIHTTGVRGAGTQSVEVIFECI